MTRDEILAFYPLEQALADHGVKVSGAGDEKTGKCPFHEDGKPSFCVNFSKGAWKCQAGCGGGSVVDFLALMRKESPVKVFSELAQKCQTGLPVKRARVDPPQPGAKREIVATYQYRNAFGEDAYQVVRYKPKDFRQRHMVDGKWVWSMEGVERVLYRLPEVLASETVWIVEGEKDADSCAALGLCGTCNVGGAGKWLDGYTTALAGKEVVLCGDTDEAGLKHIKMVFDSIADKVKQARIVKVPAPYKDVAEFIEAVPNAKEELLRLYSQAQVFTKGIHLPIFTMAELEASYAEYARNLDRNQLELGKWLPTMGRMVRGLVPGEVVTIVADTGTGKTAILQNICMKAAPLKTILFELELPGTLLFERFVGINSGFDCSLVERGYKSGDTIGPEALGRINHLYICPESRMTPQKIEEYINRSELKIGERPVVVGVDYIGLMRGTGRSRYERISEAAEEMKVIAKSTNTIIIMASQIHRKQDDDDAEIFLHDAKDSGSIEASSGLMIGAWRDKTDPNLLFLKILKNTKGKPGGVIECNFNGENMRITERSRIRPEDVPGPLPGGRRQ